MKAKLYSKIYSYINAQLLQLNADNTLNAIKTQNEQEDDLWLFIFPKSGSMDKCTVFASGESYYVRFLVKGLQDTEIQSTRENICKVIANWGCKEFASLEEAKGNIYLGY